MAPIKKALNRVPTQVSNLVELQQGNNRSYIAKDVYDATLYDEVTISDTIRETRMFQQSIAGTKNLSQTNMRSNGFVPQGKRFTIHGIKFSYVSASLKSTTQFLDFIKLLNRTTIQFYLNGKEDFGTWTALEIAGISIACPTQDVTTSNFSTQLYEPTSRVHPLNNAIVLASQQLFEMVLTHHTLPAMHLNGDLLKIGMIGIMENAN